MSDYLTILGSHCAQGEEHFAQIALELVQDGILHSTKCSSNSVVCRGKHEHLDNLRNIAPAAVFSSPDRMQMWSFAFASDAIRFFLMAASIHGISAWRTGISDNRVIARKYPLLGFHSTRSNTINVIPSIVEQITERIRAGMARHFHDRAPGSVVVASNNNLVVEDVFESVRAHCEEVGRYELEGAYGRATCFRWLYALNFKSIEFESESFARAVQCGAPFVFHFGLNRVTPR